MRFRENTGYTGYQGRRGRWWKTLLILLALILLAAALCLVIGQRYLVYTDDGIRLELPFRSAGRESAAGGDSPPMELVEQIRPARRETSPAPE